MTWEEFGDRLLRVLMTMKDRVHLSIEMPEIGDYRSISLSTEDGQLHESLITLYLQEEYRLEGDREAAMEALGWNRCPMMGDAWCTNTPLPASSTELRVVRDRFIATMRDLLRVESPGEMVYYALRDPEVKTPGVVRYEKGENPLLIEELGLPLMSTK